ncbi:MAG: tRNA 2-thiouridine(34) synthase MnmA [bacterium]|nr:tRNA 2-thiouridine(34) synthase MnmA [bacterium]
MTIAHDNRNHNKVAVALSGGVDSAVAAAILVEQGYDVTGYYMKNWTDVGEVNYRKDECPWLEEYEDVQEICKTLNIPCEIINFEREYRDKVFEYFLSEYKKGKTPNPDVMCNTEIKFKSFLKKAEVAGFDKVATGHHAQVSQNESGMWQLKRGADANKDQTYFIYHLTQEQLSKILFPIGHMQKTDVRKAAQAYNLPVADKKDSQGLCFIGDIEFRTFLEQYVPHKPGSMITVEGKNMGEHKGLAYYTIGQRYGLEIGGTGPYFVVEKDIKNNTLIICQGTDHPSLLSTWFTIEDDFWIAGNRPADKFDCTVKVRYRSPDVPCTIDGSKVLLHEAERAVTPGQFAVFYDGATVIGGAEIKKRELNISS